jgi:S-layer homology domain
MRTMVGRNIRLTVTIAAAAGVLAGSALAGPIGDEIAKSPNRLETTRALSTAYGTDDYTVTVVPAIAFFPALSNQPYGTVSSLARFGNTDTVTDFYAPIDLPRGAIVDFIGLNTLTDAPNAFGVAMYRRGQFGTNTTVGVFGSTVHAGGWGSDHNAAPLDFLLTSFNTATILHVQQGSFPTVQFFGHVEVWWRRTVSPQFAVTFNDVPASHAFYQFIEALAASGITAGCGNGNFCPDAPLTRGQMAVFLAKALGLHWPY